MLDDVALALVTAGLVTDGLPNHDWQVYKGVLEDQPDRAVGVYTTGGEAPDELWALYRPHFQVRVRSGVDDYQAGATKLQAIFDFLHSGEVNIGGTYVFVYGKESGEIPLGRDEKRRSHLVHNFRVLKGASG